MERRGLLTGFLAGSLWLLLSLFPFSGAQASIPVRLFDLGYERCPAAMQGILASGSSNEANCFMIKGKAENKTGKNIVDADVFGRIFDGNGEPTFENRGRVGTILEVPPGISEFQIPVSVSANQPEPLRLDKFKASGFDSRVRPFYYDNVDIE